MPTKRTRRTHMQIAIGGCERFHLMIGDCLMGAGCVLCDVVGDPTSLCPRVLQMDFASGVWEHHREALLADWNKPQDRDWYKRRDETYGFGWLGIPAFAEIVFDGRELPTLNSQWPEAAKNHYQSIVSNVGALEAALGGRE
jgi:hypothetical protein